MKNKKKWNIFLCLCVESVMKRKRMSMHPCSMLAEVSFFPKMSSMKNEKIIINYYCAKMMEMKTKNWMNEWMKRKKKVSWKMFKYVCVCFFGNYSRVNHKLHTIIRFCPFSFPSFTHYKNSSRIKRKNILYYDILIEFFFRMKIIIIFSFVSSSNKYNYMKFF